MRLLHVLESRALGHAGGNRAWNRDRQFAATTLPISAVDADDGVGFADVEREATALGAEGGGILWEGYLGRPVSYGCVVLGTYEAQILYDWAEIGTPVEIQW